MGDQTGSEIKDSAIFKQLTGGDAVQVEQKNKQPYSYIYPGGIVIACNNLPGFADDKGSHIFERLCIVPCINERSGGMGIAGQDVKGKRTLYLIGFWKGFTV
ncbi:MAG: DUF5906 domain-containing protein [Enterocloster sp.]